jgi:hypothetical protein
MDDNIKIDLKETGYNCVDWTHLSHVRIPCSEHGNEVSVT